MSESNTLGALLDLVAQLEDTAYGFYAKLRDRFQDRPEAAELLSAIMEDELHHARSVRAIADSLPEFKRRAAVSPDIIAQLEGTIRSIRDHTEDIFASEESIFEAIDRIESLEFDVVLSMVNVPEVEFKFSPGYASNQAEDHTNRIYRLLRSLD
jgi:rubrerythrin